MYKFFFQKVSTYTSFNDYLKKMQTIDDNDRCKITFTFSLLSLRLLDQCFFSLRLLRFPDQCPVSKHLFDRRYCSIDADSIRTVLGGHYFAAFQEKKEFVFRSGGASNILPD